MLAGVRHVCSQDYSVYLFGHVSGYRLFSITNSFSEDLAYGDWEIRILWPLEPGGEISFAISEGAGNSSCGMVTFNWTCEHSDFENAIDELIGELAAGEHRVLNHGAVGSQPSSKELPSQNVIPRSEVHRTKEFTSRVEEVDRLCDKGVISECEVARSFFEAVGYYKPEFLFVERALLDMSLLRRSHLFQVIVEIEEKGPRECYVPYWRDKAYEEDVEREENRYAQDMKNCEKLKAVLTEITE